MSYTTFLNYKNEGGHNVIALRHFTDTGKIAMEITEFLGTSASVVQVTMTVDELWDLRHRIGDLLFEIGETE